MKKGVGIVKRIYWIVLISVIFLTMTAVSATNETDNMETDSYSVDTEDTTANNEIITKNTIEDVTKTSSNANDKTASKIVVGSVSIKYNSTAKLNAKITNAKTGAKVTSGKVAFKINGNTVGYGTISNGQATYVYNAKGLTPKNYNITVKYGGNSQLLSGSGTGVLKVEKDESKIAVKQAKAFIKDNVTLVACITCKSNGHSASSGKVAFKINGITVGYANVTNGKAILSYKINSLSAKTYNLTAIYGGNNVLDSSRSSANSLIVLSRPTILKVSKVSGYSTTVTLKATVIDKYTSKNLTSGTVIFKVNDKTVGNSTVSKGVATVNYNSSQLARGTYKVSAYFKATSIFSTSSNTNNLTIVTEKSFTYNQIKTAAVYVRTQFEANNTVDSVPIGKSRIGLSEFLALMIQSCENVYKKSTASVEYKQYKTLTTQEDSIKTVKLNISQVRNIGSRTLNFMKTNGRPPKYVSTEFGNIGYYNIVYTYCRVMDVSESKYLPSTCRVYSWASMHPRSSKTRTIYITTDIIFNKDKDYAFMNSIKSKLVSLGYNVIINGYGPNSHNTAIRNQSLPMNAVQVSIFGGADPGVIYDMCTRSFMRLKESRLMFLVYHPSTSTDITGLSFLKRSHDDNYSSSSFTGISNPDIYLKNNGYDYVYSSNVNTIVNKLIAYIS